MSGTRIVLASGAIFGVIGLGFVLWSVMPGDEKRKEMIKNLPEANPARMEETQKRNTVLLQVLKEAAETNDNVARGFGSSKNA